MHAVAASQLRPPTVVHTLSRHVSSFAQLQHTLKVCTRTSLVRVEHGDTTAPVEAMVNSYESKPLNRVMYLQLVG